MYGIRFHASDRDYSLADLLKPNRRRIAGSILRNGRPDSPVTPSTATNEKPGLPRGKPGLRSTLAGEAYLSMPLTTPAPTVRPPSRIVKRWPTSMAIGAMSLTPSATLSPGMTISMPSGRTTVPVTSVVRK
jgi:hypothetical protein